MNTAYNDFTESCCYQQSFGLKFKQCKLIHRITYIAKSQDSRLFKKTNKLTLTS